MNYLGEIIIDVYTLVLHISYWVANFHAVLTFMN